MTLTAAASPTADPADTTPDARTATTAVDARSITARRSSGVLLHVSSLPSAHGIGDLGPAAYTFADQLRRCGQRYWQILPLTPPNRDSGESPYFSSSAFAGNPLLIDLQALRDEGLLDDDDLQPDQPFPDTEVDFDAVRQFKLGALSRAADRFLSAGTSDTYRAFCDAQSGWLDDYALFAALKNAMPDQSWASWPAALRDRETSAMDRARAEQASAVDRIKVLQFFFARQWEALKSYCNAMDLLIFGDMPIYVSYESADVWAHPEIFKLDAERRPTAVSGVPPDYFSATGQLWNNPVYDWARLRESGYQWWLDRMGALFERFDILRIDHFRGLVQYWEVPAGSDTAINGSWQDVPSYDFFDRLREAYPNFPVVVEDLGIITPDVIAVKEHYGLPGMLVLHFAFYEDGSHNPYLPQNHPEQALVYLGTHDNTTSVDWLQTLDPGARWRLGQQFPNREHGPQLPDLLDMALGSRAGVAIVTVQDLLELPGRARMNDPQYMQGNWRWRLTADEFQRLPWQQLRQMTARHGRSWA